MKKRYFIFILLIISIFPVFGKVNFNIESSFSELIDVVNYSESRNIFSEQEIEVSPKIIFDFFSLGFIVSSGRGNTVLNLDIYKNLGRLDYISLGIECGFIIGIITIKAKLLGKLLVFSSDYGTLHSISSVAGSVGIKLFSYNSFILSLNLPFCIDFCSYGLSYSTGIGLSLGKSV